MFILYLGRAVRQELGGRHEKGEDYDPAGMKCCLGPCLSEQI